MIDGINDNNNKYCELFTVQPLDREKKSLHFLVINISIENKELIGGKAIINEIKVDSSELTTKRLIINNERRAIELERQEREEEERQQIPKRLKRKNGRIRQNNLKENNGGSSNGREVAFNGLVER